MLQIDEDTGDIKPLQPGYMCSTSNVTVIWCPTYYNIKMKNSHHEAPALSWISHQIEAA